MKTRAVIAFLCAASALATPTQAAPDTTSFKNPLRWHKLHKGEKLKVDKDGQSDKTAKLVTKRADGTPVTIDIAPTRTFMGTAFYVADLPPAIREVPSYIDFSIGATVGSDADHGTIINVDGAIIGFQVIPGTSRVNIMVVDVDEDGKPAWKKAHWTIPMEKTRELSDSPRMAVRPNYASGKWDLYHYGIPICAGIALFQDSDTPTISIKPGFADEDKAVLKRLRLSEAAEMPAPPVGVTKEFPVKISRMPEAKKVSK